MRANTKFFGLVDIDDEKVIEFVHGIIGFENLKKFAIIFDNECEGRASISWLQSLEEPSVAFPVVDPLYVKEDYNPIVEDEIIRGLGDSNGDDLFVLLSMTVPSDITKMTVNLKAPFIINPTTKKACQIIVDNVDYEVKYKIYDKLQNMKKVGE